MGPFRGSKEASAEGRQPQRPQRPKGAGSGHPAAGAASPPAQPLFKQQLPSREGSHLAVEQAPLSWSSPRSSPRGFEAGVAGHALGAPHRSLAAERPQERPRHGSPRPAAAGHAQRSGTSAASLPGRTHGGGGGGGEGTQQQRTGQGAAEPGRPSPEPEPPGRGWEDPPAQDPVYLYNHPDEDPLEPEAAVPAQQAQQEEPSAAAEEPAPTHEAGAPTAAAPGDAGSSSNSCAAVAAERLAGSIEPSEAPAPQLPAAVGAAAAAAAGSLAALCPQPQPAAAAAGDPHTLAQPSREWQTLAGGIAAWKPAEAPEEGAEPSSSGQGSAAERQPGEQAPAGQLLEETPQEGQPDSTLAGGGAAEPASARESWQGRPDSSRGAGQAALQRGVGAAAGDPSVAAAVMAAAAADVTDATGSQPASSSSCELEVAPEQQEGRLLATAAGEAGTPPLGATAALHLPAPAKGQTEGSAAEGPAVVEDEGQPAQGSSEASQPEAGGGTATSAELEAQRARHAEQLRIEVRARQELEEMLLRIERHFKAEQAARRQAEEHIKELTAERDQLRAALEEALGRGADSSAAAALAEQQAALDRQGAKLEALRSEVAAELTKARAEVQRAAEALQGVEEKARASEEAAAASKRELAGRGKELAASSSRLDRLGQWLLRCGAGQPGGLPACYPPPHAAPAGVKPWLAGSSAAAMGRGPAAMGGSGGGRGRLPALPLRGRVAGGGGGEGAAAEVQGEHGLLLPPLMPPSYGSPGSPGLAGPQAGSPHRRPLAQAAHRARPSPPKRSAAGGDREKESLRDAARVAYMAARWKQGAV